MSRVRIVVMLVVAVLLFGQSEATAQVGGGNNLVAREGLNVGFRWAAAAGATWYYLWVNDASNQTRHNRWYPASELGCGPGQAAVCKIGLTLDAVPGRLMWWVQTYNDAGYGPWTGAQYFTPGPLAAVIAPNGVMSRGNAFSSLRLTTGTYEVIFDRNVTQCIYNVNVSGVGGETPFGLASAANRTGNVNGVFVIVSNAAGTLVDLPFHLTVVCGATNN